MATEDEERLFEFIYACPVGLIECDAAGDIALINPHAMKHLLPLAGDRDPSNIFKMLERHAPELRHLVSRFDWPTGQICDGHRIMAEFKMDIEVGDPKILACTIVKLGPNRLMMTLSDVSADVAREERLRQADAWFATLLDPVNDYAVVILTATGVIKTIDERFKRQTGLTAEQAVGRPLVSVLGEESCERESSVNEQLAIAARDGWHLLEGWQQRASGERYWCQRLIVAHLDDDASRVAGFSAVLRDVPRREAATDELRRLLTCDHLTGASNRMHFGQMLDRAVRQWDEAKLPLSLVSLDLDHFKQVNDTYGHPIGDVLLCQVAKVCLALVPPRATFARLGGEEFGILLPRYTLDEARDVAETMRTAIASIQIPVADGTLSTTASFGCASMGETVGSARALSALADERLYAAKRDGRNLVHPLGLVTA